MTPPGTVWGSIWTAQGCPGHLKYKMPERPQEPRGFQERSISKIRGPTRWVGGTRERGYNPPHTFRVLRRVKSVVQTTYSGLREPNPFRDAPPPLARPTGYCRPNAGQCRSMQFPSRSTQHFRPRWLQERLRCLQDGPRALQERSRCAQDASRALQEAHDAI